MRFRSNFLMFAVTSLLLASSISRADISMGSCSPDQKATVSTQHTGTFGGKQIAYTATVGFMEVQSADQSAQACIFYTAYTVQAQTSPQTPRPVLFAFNGGPGSASLWLHLGLLGPKRVDLGSDGLQPARALTLVDNTDSPLDVTDVVMIDPVATGFSHAEGAAPNDKFFGVKNDYVSIGAFIQNFLNINKRWNSPKFILGESYGGIRGPLLTQYLQDSLGIGVDGLVLVSPALSGASLNFGQADNNIPFWTFFPNFAATAWYHKRLSPALQALTVDQLYRRAQMFASSRLRDALDTGVLLSNATLERVANQMSEYIGLDKALLINNGLRIDDGTFFGALLKSSNQVVGRFDSRFVGAALSTGSFDPSDTFLVYPFTAGINSYLRGDLAWPLVSPYTTSAAISSWPGWEGNDGVLTQLLQSLIQNPNLKVMVTSGYFDLACPMGTVDYELAHLPGPAGIRSRISRKFYYGGHMSYINPTELTKMKTDISTFITGH